MRHYYKPLVIAVLSFVFYPDAKIIRKRNLRILKYLKLRK